MRIKIFSYDHSIKGLDIDLKLENPSRDKVSKILATLNSVINREEGLNKIPDEAEVVRTDLYNADQEALKEFKNVLKYSNRNDIFVFLTQEDKIIAIVVAYNVLFNLLGQDFNINDFIRESHYVIRISSEEPLKTDIKQKKRAEQREGSPAVKRETNIQSRKEIIDWEIEKLLPDLEKYYKQSNLVERSDLGQENPEIVVIERKKAKDIVVGDLLKAGNGNYGVVIKATPSQDSDYITFEYDLYTTSNTKVPYDNKVQRINANEELAVSELIYPEELDPFFEELAPEKIDWVKMLKQGQRFPNSLFLNSSPALKKTLRESWEKIVEMVNNEDRSLAESQAKESFQSKLEKGNIKSRSYTELTYTDKSGYKVDLSKYFPTLLKLPPKVPKEVEERYEVIFKEVSKLSSAMVSKIKEYADNEDWVNLEKLSIALRKYNPRSYNSRFFTYLQEDSYEKGSAEYVSKKKVIEELNEYIDEMKERLKDFLPNEEIEINLNQ